MVKVKHFRPFFGDDVEICRYEKRLVLPVKFPESSLDAVSDDRVPHLLAHGEADPGAGFLILPEQQKMLGVHLRCSFVELQELRTFAQAFVFGKLRVGQEKELLGGDAHGETLAPLGPSPLDHEPAVFGGHPDEEAVSSLSGGIAGLERSFHLYDSLRVL